MKISAVGMPSGAGGVTLHEIQKAHGDGDGWWTHAFALCGARFDLHDDWWSIIATEPSAITCPECRGIRTNVERQP